MQKMWVRFLVGELRSHSWGKKLNWASGSTWSIGWHSGNGLEPQMAERDGTENEQLSSGRVAVLRGHQVPSICTVTPGPKLAAPTWHPLIYSTTLVPRVTVCMFCYRDQKVLFLGQFRSSGSCSLRLYCVGLLQNVFESCFGIRSSIFTHSHWNKLLLWTLKTLPLHFF